MFLKQERSEIDNNERKRIGFKENANNTFKTFDFLPKAKIGKKWTSALCNMAGLFLYKHNFIDLFFLNCLLFKLLGGGGVPRP